ncbi:hypothetical protein WKI71_14005 [Streptomyces sp. MS1.AVA.1]|uniref:Secreted protein n=1 Tax=Streptomyces machairae TaxID=3134109 RepID=A0ABU8UJR4_9ACTN
MRGSLAIATAGARRGPVVQVVTVVAVHFLVVRVVLRVVVLGVLVTATNPAAPLRRPPRGPSACRRDRRRLRGHLSGVRGLCGPRGGRLVVAVVMTTRAVLAAAVLPAAVLPAAAPVPPEPSPY